MVRDCCKLLWQTIQLAAIGFLWKHQCKVTVNEIPRPLTLGELRSFKQELASLLRVNLGAFCCDVECLLMGGRVHLLAFLAYIHWEFPGTPVVHKM